MKNTKLKEMLVVIGEAFLIAGITIVAVLEVATTVYLAVKATPKAEKLIEEAEKKKGDKLTKTETVKAAWKCYIPAAITGACAVACMVGSNTILTKRNAALTAACQLTESAFKDYSDKVIETIGEKKEEAIQDAIAQDYLNTVSIDESKIINTGEGNTLFHDWASGRDFRHDKNKIEKACNDLNYRMLTENYLSLNEFYDEIGLPNIGIGDEYGWNINKRGGGLIEVKFSPCLATNGEPCLLVHFSRGHGPMCGYKY